MIVILDYGVGNVGAIANMLKRVGHSAVVTCDHKLISNATRIVLPGVGAFDYAVDKLEKAGLHGLLDEKVLVEKVPILGICLGMQLLTRGSEEGSLPGFAWVPAETVRLPGDLSLKIPHMGWNVVRPTKESPITKGFDNTFRFYFVHSYHVVVDYEGSSILSSQYGIDFCAAIQKENIFGVQFHPEKSHRFGMRLLKNFAELKC